MKRVVKNGAPGSRQAYMNKSKFNPDRYKQEKDRVSRDVEFGMGSLCCRRCCEIIQWKVDYGKYAPQEQSRKCNLCHEKKVVHTCHRICQGCAEREALCAKCQRPAAALAASPETEGSDVDLDQESDGGVPSSLAKIKEPSKYAFVDVPSEEAELHRLTGLNTRVLQQNIRRKREEERRDALGALRERERRTVLRKATVQADYSDSDESL